MPTLFEKVETKAGDFQISTPVAGTAITFSNSGRRGDRKWFSLTVAELISALEDIRENLGSFRQMNAGTYVETPMRILFDRHLGNGVINALAQVQTKPVYTLLGKIIHFASSDEPYQETTLDLDPDKIDLAIRALRSESTALMEVAVGRVPPKPAGGERLKGGDNILYYGAPGTGKSYTANALGEAEQARTFRTVFHPDMQNSDFVGALKPALDANGAVTYEFRPGPFARALRFARENPTLRVHLVIEELNRAMAAAVFGELFQLLDRNTDGESEYCVDAPSDEFATWYGERTIALPSNLWILATMNSADQGVYPLDTAFRRRWRQEYVRIDYTKAPDNHVTLANGREGKIELPWRQFVEHLNAFLTNRLDIAEDRLVGPRFVKESELAGGRLPGKLLIYLWDDLLRHHGRHTLFLASIKSYGELDKAATEDIQFLDNAFLATLLPEVAV